MKRVFLVVLDSVGIGELPDAASYGDEGSNTLKSVSKSNYYKVPNLEKLGLYNIDGVSEVLSKEKGVFDGVVGKMAEKSFGKDTTIGHWEIAGIVSKEPLPVFPEGFPYELLKGFEEATGRKVICNKPYSGTEVIKDYGRKHIETGALIVYTSADSVFQIAAHEEVVPLEELYRFCQAARELCTGRYAVGRVIARPFSGEWPFIRTKGRHDYSLTPPDSTMLDLFKEKGFDVISIGKINDIFAGAGITDVLRTKDNYDGIESLLMCMEKDFCGLCFVNLVDFDMLYGHRNDIDGYAKALTYFDLRIPDILNKLREEDMLIITADHGCDPGTLSTDHSREYVPMIMYGSRLKKGANLGTRASFADIGKSLLDYFEIENNIEGSSFIQQILSI